LQSYFSHFRFDLLENTKVTLAVYNVAGREVRILPKGLVPAGHHKIEWNGKDGHGASVLSGVYFYRPKARTRDQARKAIVLK
jgi:flagellar hook assembly protein FlgD